MEHEKAFYEGLRAGRNGLGKFMNPYRRGCDKYCWDSGWQQGKDERAGESDHGR